MTLQEAYFYPSAIPLPGIWVLQIVWCLKGSRGGQMLQLLKENMYCWLEGTKKMVRVHLKNNSLSESTFK